MHNSDRDWNLSLNSLERHVVQEHGLTLTQHHGGKQKLISQVFPEQAIEKVLPVLTTLGRRVLHTGPLGSASVLKVMTNYLATVNLTNGSVEEIETPLAVKVQTNQQLSFPNPTFPLPKSSLWI